MNDEHALTAGRKRQVSNLRRPDGIAEESLWHPLGLQGLSQNSQELFRDTHGTRNSEGRSKEDREQEQ